MFFFFRQTLILKISVYWLLLTFFPYYERKPYRKSRTLFLSVPTLSDHTETKARWFLRAVRPKQSWQWGKRRRSPWWCHYARMKCLQKVIEKYTLSRRNWEGNLTWKEIWICWSTCIRIKLKLIFYEVCETQQLLMEGEGVA